MYRSVGFQNKSHNQGLLVVFDVVLGPTLAVSKVPEAMHKARLRALEGLNIRSKSPKEFKSKKNLSCSKEWKRIEFPDIGSRQINDKYFLQKAKIKCLRKFARPGRASEYPE